MSRALWLVLLASSVAVGQGGSKVKPPELPPTAFPMILANERAKQLTPPSLPPAKQTDEPAVKEGRAQLALVGVARERMIGRVQGGINIASEFQSYCGLADSIAAAATAVFQKPADRVAWYEHRIRMTKDVEQYFRDTIASDVGMRGLEQTRLSLLASVSRLDAEIALLKLKERIGE